MLEEEVELGIKGEVDIVIDDEGKVKLPPDLAARAKELGYEEAPLEDDDLLREPTDFQDYAEVEVEEEEFTDEPLEIAEEELIRDTPPSKEEGYDEKPEDLPE